MFAALTAVTTAAGFGWSAINDRMARIEKSAGIHDEKPWHDGAGERLAGIDADLAILKNNTVDRFTATEFDRWEGDLQRRLTDHEARMLRMEVME